MEVSEDVLKVLTYRATLNCSSQEPMALWLTGFYNLSRISLKWYKRYRGALPYKTKRRMHVPLNRVWFLGGLESWIGHTYNLWQFHYLTSWTGCVFGSKAWKIIWRLVMNGLLEWYELSFLKKIWVFYDASFTQLPYGRRYGSGSWNKVSSLKQAGQMNDFCLKPTR